MPWVADDRMRRGTDRRLVTGLYRCGGSCPRLLRVSRRRPIPFPFACRPMFWLLLAVLATGGRVGLNSRAADRLTSSLAGAGLEATAVLCGRSHHDLAGRQTTPDLPPAPSLACVLSAGDDAPPDLVRSAGVAVGRSSGTMVHLGERRPGPAEMVRAAGTRPYPRGPPGRG